MAAAGRGRKAGLSIPSQRQTVAGTRSHGAARQQRSTQQHAELHTDWQQQQTSTCSAPSTAAQRRPTYSWNVYCSKLASPVVHHRHCAGAEHWMGQVRHRLVCRRRAEVQRRQAVPVVACALQQEKVRGGWVWFSRARAARVLQHLGMRKASTAGPPPAAAGTAHGGQHEHSSAAAAHAQRRQLRQAIYTPVPHRVLVREHIVAVAVRGLQNRRL